MFKIIKIPWKFFQNLVKIFKNLTTAQNFHHFPSSLVPFISIPFLNPSHHCHTLPPYCRRLNSIPFHVPSSFLQLHKNLRKKLPFSSYIVSHCQGSSHSDVPDVIRLQISLSLTPSFLLLT